MAKYKVGDIVRVRRDLSDTKHYCNEDGMASDVAIAEMMEFAGKWCTIENITPNGKYVLKEDACKWAWVDDMFDARKPDEDDKVSHPSHYTQGKIEVIDFIQDKNLDFARGNVVKYVVRAGHKPEGDSKKELEDLKKAKQYIEFAIRATERKVYQ